MKERPILFSAPMVRAIMEGRKCMTRRVVKPQPYLLYRPETYKVKVDNWGQCAWIDEEGHREHIRGWDNPAYTVCAYGKVGDRLWVRETFWHREAFHADYLMDYRYCATEPMPPGSTEPNETLEGYWRKMPSIFMPRDASRITLEITGVRVERLQEISEADAVAEGIFEFCGLGIYGYDKKGTPGLHCCDSARETFRCLWDSINDKNPPKGEIRQGIRPCSWDGNPWVWVVEFVEVH